MAGLLHYQGNIHTQEERHLGGRYRHLFVLSTFLVFRVPADASVCTKERFIISPHLFPCILRLLTTNLILFPSLRQHCTEVVALCNAIPIASLTEERTLISSSLSPITVNSPVDFGCFTFPSLRACCSQKGILT